MTKQMNECNVLLAAYIYHFPFESIPTAMLGRQRCLVSEKLSRLQQYHISSIHTSQRNMSFHFNLIIQSNNPKGSFGLNQMALVPSLKHNRILFGSSSINNVVSFLTSSITPSLVPPPQSASNPGRLINSSAALAICSCFPFLIPLPS